MRLWPIRPLFSVFFLGTCIFSELHAQTTTSGGLTVVVTDASGAVVIKATVTLRSNEKGFSQSVTTNAEGVYRFPFLAPGSYTVSIAVPGFEATSRLVTVSVGQTSSVDLRLEVGPANTTVAVTADAPLLQTESADGSTVFNASQIVNLPNPGNDLTKVAQTAPGTVMKHAEGRLWRSRELFDLRFACDLQPPPV